MKFSDSTIHIGYYEARASVISSSRAFKAAYKRDNNPLWQKLRIAAVRTALDWRSLLNSQIR